MTASVAQTPEYKFPHNIEKRNKADRCACGKKLGKADILQQDCYIAVDTESSQGEEGADEDQRPDHSPPRLPAFPSYRKTPLRRRGRETCPRASFFFPRTGFFSPLVSFSCPRASFFLMQTSFSLLSLCRILQKESLQEEDSPNDQGKSLKAQSPAMLSDKGTGQGSHEYPGNPRHGGGNSQNGSLILGKPMPHQESHGDQSCQTAAQTSYGTGQIAKP